MLVGLVDEAIQGLADKPNYVPAKTPALVGISSGNQTTIDPEISHLDPENGAGPKESNVPRGHSQDVMLGVSDYLRRTVYDVEQLLHASSIPNLSYIGPGTKPITGSMMINDRLSNLLTQLKSDYSFVIVSGTRLAQHLQLESLSTNVDGVVISCRGDNLQDCDSIAVRNLIAANVHVLGIVA